MREIRAHRPDAVLYGYDPYVAGASPAFDRIEDLEQIPPGSVDLICAFEVLEHMTRDGWADFARFCQRALSRNPRARIVLSVPVMLGPVLLLKTLNSYVFKRKHAEYSLPDLIASSIFHREVAPAVHPAHSHKGFDFRRLKRFLGGGFVLEDEFFSPYRRLYYGLNSQCFLTLRLADDGARLAA